MNLDSLSRNRHAFGINPYHLVTQEDELLERKDVAECGALSLLRNKLGKHSITPKKENLHLLRTVGIEIETTSFLFRYSAGTFDVTLEVTPDENAHDITIVVAEFSAIHAMYNPGFWLGQVYTLTKNH